MTACEVRKTLETTAHVSCHLRSVNTAMHKVTKTPKNYSMTQMWSSSVYTVWHSNQTSAAHTYREHAHTRAHILV